jgi:cytochrome P450
VAPPTEARPTSNEAKRLFLRMVRPTAHPDPYPAYARLREIGTVVPVVFPGVAPRYLVTSFAECSAMLRDDNIGPLTEAHFHETNPTWREQGLARSLFGSMAFHSGVEHRLDRAMFARHFSPKRTARRRADLVEVAETLLDRLAELGADGTPVDIERELGVPYSALVIGRLMGIPDEQAIRLGWLTRQSSATLELAPSPAQRAHAAEHGEQMRRELAELGALRRREPQDDMVTDLAVQCGEDEERLVSSLVLLFSAGFDSPVSLIGLGLQLFLDNPEQARLLRQSPELADLATEEILRCEPPVQIMFRAARSDVTLGGHTIPKGSILLGLIASALRDSAQVDDPERFDITRRPSSGLSFGGGAHYCLGAHLARLSATVLFPALLRRFPDIRPAGAPTYRAPGVALRGLESLPVALTRPLTPSTPS